VTAGEAAPAEALLRSASAFYFSQSLYALVKLGIAASLARRAATAGELCAELSLAETPAALLLEACAASGYLERGADERYRLAAAFEPYLNPADERYAGDAIANVVEFSYDAWSGLTEHVRTGAAPVSLQQRRAASAELARRSTRGSDQIARRLAGAIAPHLAGPVDSVLDVGCGSAALTRRLLDAWPAARATLIDLATVLSATADYLTPAQRERCTLLARDATAPEPFPGRHDVVILSNVVHVVPAGELGALVRRACDATAANGTVVVTSFFVDEPSSDTAFTSHFSLSCHLLSGSARGLSCAQARALLEACGMTRLRVVETGSTTRAILAARRG